MLLQGFIFLGGGGGGNGEAKLGKGQIFATMAVGWIKSKDKCT